MGDSRNSHKRGLLVRQPGPSPDNAPPTAYDDRGSPAEGSPRGGPSGFFELLGGAGVGVEARGPHGDVQQREHSQLHAQ